MINSKEEILKIVDTLPDDATLEDAIYTLIFYSKLQRSQDDIKNGRVMTLEEFRKHIDKLEEKIETDNIK